MAIQALLVILAVLLVLLFLGVPISYAIAVSSLTAILSSIDLNVAVLTAAQRTFVGMSKFSLTAIPFFILAGNIMNQGGIAKRLVDFVMSILGKLPGALLITNIGTNALFGAISGSASAAAAAVGSMIRDGAEEQGYDPAVTAATNAASSCSGLLIPPSNALITYSLASGGTSVAALFMAGYVPGIIWALACAVVGVILAKKLGYKGTPGKFDWKNLGVCTLRALPSLSLIIVVIGGIVGGVFSATEGSAIAVVYALILAFCYRSINLKSLWKIIVDSAKMSGMVVFLVGVSNILGWVMAFLQIPRCRGGSAAGPDQQQVHHPPDHERHPAGVWHLYGCYPGDPDLHPAVPAHLPELWHEHHPLWYDPRVQPLHRQHHAPLSATRCSSASRWAVPAWKRSCLTCSCTMSPSSAACCWSLTSRQCPWPCLS